MIVRVGRRFRYWSEVFKRAIVAAGWVAGVVTLVIGGSVLAASGFLYHYHYRPVAVSVVAAGAIVALLEGSYRVWNDADKKLQATRARLRDLDTHEARRAYVEQQIARAGLLQRTIESVGDRWGGSRRTFEQDIVHWENAVRATLRESFAPGSDLLFDSEDGFELGDRMHQNLEPEGQLEYLKRRIARLREIAKDL
jgi:hypothetical protein